MVQMPEYMVQQMADSKTRDPDRRVHRRPSGFDTSPFLPRVLLEPTRPSGVQWSMPFNVSDPVLYYNRQMFEAAGLDPDQPPMSLDELRATSQQLVD